MVFKGGLDMAPNVSASHLHALQTHGRRELLSGRSGVLVSGTTSVHNTFEILILSMIVIIVKL